jgi:hypothetical protein
MRDEDRVRVLHMIDAYCEGVQSWPAITSLAREGRAAIRQEELF